MDLISRIPRVPPGVVFGCFFGASGGTFGHPLASLGSPVGIFGVFGGSLSTLFGIVWGLRGAFRHVLMLLATFWGLWVHL